MAIGTSMRVQVLIMHIVNLGLCIPMYVSSGIMDLAPTEIGVRKCMPAGHVQKLGKWVSLIRHLRMKAPIQEVGKIISVPSNRSIPPCLSSFSQGKNWSPGDFIKVHKEVRESGLYNLQGCRIPIPTLIRHDRIREALGEDISQKEERTLSLLEFGMPIGCKDNFGVQKKQKNHQSAVSFKEEIDEFFNKNVKMQVILGPYEISPIEGLRFSPIMSVPRRKPRGGL